MYGNTHDNKYLSTVHKGEDKWVKALLASEDKMYNMYSENCKDNATRELIIK